MKGKFITVEGVEGVGKSTNIAFVKQYIQDRGLPVVATREPGGTPLAEELRETLLQNRDEPVDAYAELLLVFSARAQHLNTLILPALGRGEWVLSDRFTDATFAYQGGGRGMSKQVIAALEAMVQGSVQPDLTILLDLDVATGMERARKRGQLDRFESEELAFFQRVRQAYMARVASEPERFCVVDAGQALVQVQADIAKALDTLF